MASYISFATEIIILPPQRMQIRELPLLINIRRVYLVLVQLIVDMNKRFNSCNWLWLCLYIHGLDNFRSHGLCSFELHLLIVEGLSIGMTLLEEKITQKLSQDIKQ